MTRTLSGLHRSISPTTITHERLLFWLERISLNGVCHVGILPHTATSSKADMNKHCRSWATKTQRTSSRVLITREGSLLISMATLHGMSLSATGRRPTAQTVLSTVKNERETESKRKTSNSKLRCAICGDYVSQSAMPSTEPVNVTRTL
jgi:hypothetical protein